MRYFLDYSAGIEPNRDPQKAPVIVLLVVSVLLTVGCIVWGNLTLRHFQEKEHREILTGVDAERYYSFWSGEIQDLIGTVLQLTLAGVIVHQVSAKRWSRGALSLLIVNVLACAALVIAWYGLNCEAFP